MPIRCLWTDKRLVKPQCRIPRLPPKGRNSGKLPNVYAKRTSYFLLKLRARRRPPASVCRREPTASSYRSNNYVIKTDFYPKGKKRRKDTKCLIRDGVISSHQSNGLHKVKVNLKTYQGRLSARDLSRGTATTLLSLRPWNYFKVMQTRSTNFEVRAVLRTVEFKISVIRDLRIIGLDRLKAGKPIDKLLRSLRQFRKHSFQNRKGDILTRIENRYVDFAIFELVSAAFELRMFGLSPDILRSPYLSGRTRKIAKYRQSLDSFISNKGVCRERLDFKLFTQRKGISSLARLT